ncbi:MAG TPA: helix-turn-helix domain-containing protein [Cyclobacteriaceae bacterium]|nr:helix-turn-helix domain-containing protein [Cyclobacteriaceae bacterium]
MEVKSCSKSGLAIRDALDIVGGKWKLPILHVLTAEGPMRFKELQRSLEGITARMLSKELKELELNRMVTRDVFDTAPVTVIYTVTQHGMSLCPVIEALHNWGTEHRKKIFEYD